MTVDITRAPLTPAMVETAAQAMWEAVTHGDRGSLSWDEVKTLDFPAEMLRSKAQVALEAAIPQDAEFLRTFGRECLRVADIL